jgi:opacity protein-like surface antigen
MTKTNAPGQRWFGKHNLGLSSPRLLVIVVSLLLAGASCSARAQVRESGTEDHPSLWAGGGASLYNVQYGEQKLVGITAFFDADSARRIGIEGEGRWLEFHESASVHAETYMIGPRYHFDIGRFQPYVKGMVGFGEFNFPYNFAHGSYLLVAAGGGVDYRLSRRWSVRLADVEYQNWPQFTFGSMTSVGVSAGIRYRIF